MPGGVLVATCATIMFASLVGGLMGSLRLYQPLYRNQVRVLQVTSGL